MDCEHWIDHGVRSLSSSSLRLKLRKKLILVIFSITEVSVLITVSLIFAIPSVAPFGKNLGGKARN
jgi:hypothetical protein